MTTTESTKSETPFLDELDKATTVSGVYLWNDFLEDAEDAFALLNDDTKMPWDLKPHIAGEKLTQHAYQFNRTQKEVQTHEGLALIDSICHHITSRFDCQVTDVFCNRFVDSNHHHIDWHRDTYGTHIFVLSLGSSSRNVQFRKNFSRDVETLTPNAGDIYFMPLALNKTHKHRVCRGDKDDGDGTRISLVFFAKTPRYATQFKISRLDKVVGAFHSFMDG